MKKRTTRVLSIILVLMLAFALLPTTAFAASSGLPDGYQRLEYIENNNGAYIKTGYAPHYGLNVYLDMQITNWNGNYTSVMGSRTGNHAKGTFIMCRNDWNNGIRAEIGNQNYSYPSGGDYNRGTAWNWMSSKTYTGLELYLFGINTNGSLYSSHGTATYRLYGCKFVTDTTVRDFVPAKRLSDGEIGLYDTVGKKFYTSANSAKFTGAEAPYYVSYNGNGYTGGSTSQQTAYFDQTSYIKSNGFTRTGYTFKNWNTSSNGNGTTLQPGASFSNLVTNVRDSYNLYAQWSKNQNLTYNANGHGTAPAVLSQTYDKVTKVADAISEPGYFFEGWNTKADGTGTLYAPGTQIKNADVDPTALTLYAQWTNDAEHHGFATIKAATDDPNTDQVDNAMDFDVLAAADVGLGDDYANVTYYVNVAWNVDVSSLGVKEYGSYEWSTEELKYVPQEGLEVYDTEGNAKTTVTVTNRSNAAVNYAISFSNKTATSGFTTSEAKAPDSAADVSGMLETADRNNVSSESDRDDYVYKINVEGITAEGNEEQSAEYKGIVTVTSVTEGTKVNDKAELSLGTYTVTLSAPTAPVADGE